MHGGEGFRVGELVEIAGQPGSGKSILSLQAIAFCLLPEERGGSNSHAILVDLGVKE